jgi:N-acylneuraminate cytidylyltransferase
MNVAFIPVRGGSKSIPLKNIREIAGRPLVYWTAKAACDCEDIDIVYICTDSDRIRETVEELGLDKVRVIGRSEENASDTASTESVMLEFADKYEFDNIVLIQATSPMLTGKDLNEGFKLFKLPDTDSVMSVVRQKRFHWSVDGNGYAVPLNYDPFNRPRRQEFEGYLVENGAFFITGKSKLIESKNRISGNIRVYEMDESSYFEIDEPSDWIIIEQLLKNGNRH